jgi:acyl-coenzyme A thioesterase PaaI-like protein
MTDQTEALRELPSHYHRCFGCGDDHPTGLKLKMRGGGDVIEGSFVVTEHHQGAPGLAHGGVLSAAVDEAMGFILYLLASPAVTRHLDVDFLKPVPVGSELMLKGKVNEVDGRKIFTSIEGSVDGEVAIVARALFIKVGFEHFKAHIEKSKEEIEGTPYNP